MDRGVHDDQVGPGALEAIDRAFAAVRHFAIPKRRCRRSPGATRRRPAPDGARGHRAPTRRRCPEQEQTEKVGEDGLTSRHPQAHRSPRAPAAAPPRTHRLHHRRPPLRPPHRLPRVHPLSPSRFPARFAPTRRLSFHYRLYCPALLIFSCSTGGMRDCARRRVGRPFRSERTGRTERIGGNRPDGSVDLFPRAPAVPAANGRAARGAAAEPGAATHLPRRCGCRLRGRRGSRPS